MNARQPDVSVVVVTYNWPQALEKTLRALAAQDVLPLEVIVADDGSGDATRDCLQRAAEGYPVPLRHCWQPDLGFRAALARNRAIAAASGDYVVLLDGDMLPHPKFVADHLAAARRGSFVQGMRVLTTAEARERLLRPASGYPGFFDAGIERRRHTLRIPWLSRLAAALGDPESTRAIKTCNQGWWRGDLIALNGFDERFEGWGREDRDLAVRAVFAGLQRRSLRFAGLAAHLHHSERHEGGASPNDALLAETVATRRTRSVVGIDRHLQEFAAHPLPDLRGMDATVATADASMAADCASPVPEWLASAAFGH
jgi:glycosyltransferase involved in cell wall biosynthesis